MKMNAILPNSVGILVVLYLTSCNYVSGTEIPPGDIHRFRPVLQLDKVAKFAGEQAKIASIKASYVLHNGEMDLDAKYKNAVKYWFIVSAANEEEFKPKGDSPPGMEKKAPKIALSIVTVETPHIVTQGHGQSLSKFEHRGMSRYLVRFETEASGLKRIAPKPKCNFKTLWDKAIPLGANARHSAEINYSKDGYTFKLNGDKFSLSFDHGCNVIKQKP